MVEVKCRLCKSSSSKVIYKGPIRKGGVESDYIDGYEIRQCTNCKYAYLFPEPEGIEEFYESDNYRKEFDDETDLTVIQKKYVHEQNSRIKRIGLQNLYGKSIADLGAGSGIFLNTIIGIAGKTYAVEPMVTFHKHLNKFGHKCFSYVDELYDTGVIVDVATSFDTIEHLKDPRTFVEKAYGILNKKGVFYLSMPQLNDLLNLLIPEVYNRFNFQLAHLSYFTRDSVIELFKGVGFKKVEIGYLHKYDIDNILRWHKFGSPGILETGNTFDLSFNDIFRAEIERLGIASHLFVVAKKGD